MAEARPPGIVPAGPAVTFDDHVVQVNATPAALRQLADQPDEGPIVMLNLLRYRPRRDRAIYNRYAAVAGGEVARVGAVVAYHAPAPSDPRGADLGWSDDWDAVVMPVYPRRASYLELQRSPRYQDAIADRVAGTFARLLYVLRDGEPLLPATSSIAALAASGRPIEAGPHELVVCELLRFTADGGADHARRLADAAGPLIARAGGEVVLSVRAEVPIVSHERWDHVTLTRYPSVDAYAALVASAEWQAAQPMRADAFAGHLAVATTPRPRAR